MLNSQYKNIVQWTIRYNQLSEDETAVNAIRILFNNLGVALPQGNLDDITKILKTKTFMGWRPCTCKDAKRFANSGVTTMAISGDKAVLILPDKDVDNFTDDSSLNETKSRFIAYADDVSETDYGDALFFAYSYGYVFED